MVLDVLAAAVRARIVYDVDRRYFWPDTLYYRPNMLAHPIAWDDDRNLYVGAADRGICGIHVSPDVIAVSGPRPAQGHIAHPLSVRGTMRLLASEYPSGKGRLSKAHLGVGERCSAGSDVGAPS
jgi:hypothetical protein